MENGGKMLFNGRKHAGNEQMDRRFMFMKIPRVYWHNPRSQVSIYRTVGPLVFIFDPNVDCGRGCSKVYPKSTIKNFPINFSNFSSKNLCSIRCCTCGKKSTSLYFHFSKFMMILRLQYVPGGPSSPLRPLSIIFPFNSFGSRAFSNQCMVKFQYRRKTGKSAKFMCTH